MRRAEQLEDRAMSGKADSLPKSTALIDSILIQAREIAKRSYRPDIDGKSEGLGMGEGGEGKRTDRGLN